MTDESVVGDQPRQTSPWPIYVAVGIAVAEFGVFLGVFAVAVLGLLVLGGSVAGMATEAGYASAPWGPLLAAGTLLAAAGVAVIAWQAPGGALGLATFGRDPALSRALAVLVGGGGLAVAGAVGALRGRLSD